MCDPGPQDHTSRILQEKCAPKLIQNGRAAEIYSELISLNDSIRNTHELSW